VKKKLAIYIIFGIIGLFALAGGVYGYLYASTPEHIRNPKFEHYHFRTQIVVEGKSVDFSSDEFQEEYDAGSCSIELAGLPIDFHDNVDQMAHVHWDGMTGGEFLKYFGWNFIGGKDTSLGQRYDNGLMSMHTVTRYGNLLPAIPDNANFYVYTGDENDYEKKDWNDFLNQDLEDFFSKKSNLNQDEVVSAFNIFDRLIPKASAHGGVMDQHNAADGEEKSQEELTRINNLIGNVVIFVQKDEPTDEQIRERFASLVPLQDSACGG
jgi:hypothetical protein